MTETYQLLIGGEFTDAASGETFDSIDPSTGKAFAKVAMGGLEDVRRATQAARAAFDEGPWPRMKGRERAQHLQDPTAQAIGMLAVARVVMGQSQ